MPTTIQQLLDAIDRFRSSIVSNAKTLADYGPYSYKKLTKDVLRLIDKARKVAEKGDADAIWAFDELWESVSDEIENVDEGGNLGLCESNYYNDVSELSLQLGIQLGIWQPKNSKGGYDLTPEWEAKIEAEDTKKPGTAYYKDISYPYCKQCGHALKSVDEYHICGNSNIEHRPTTPPKDKIWIRDK